MPGRAVPVGRRALLAQPARLAVALIAVAAAVALVLLLTGLRRGIGAQVTVYLTHQPSVVVGQAGTRDFLSQTSLIPDETAARVAAVRGVADASPVSEGYAMLSLHGKRVLSVLIGYDRGRRGGPWQLASGRLPRDGELVLDRVLAAEHGLRAGAILRFRGARLRVVGRSRGTSGFMTPLIFTTRTTANMLSQQPHSATFLLVTPRRGVTSAQLADRIANAVPGVSAFQRDELADRDRQLFVGSFSGPLTAMIAIAAAVAVLVIALTVYTQTRDRSRDYATLKALGLTRLNLARLVAAQAAAISLVGTALGIALAVVAAQAVDALAPKYLIVIGAGDAGRMALVAVVFALLAAAAPCRYLARLDPATAFKTR